MEGEYQMIRFVAFDKKTEEKIYIYGLTLENMIRLIKNESCLIGSYDHCNLLFVGGTTEIDVEKNIIAACKERNINLYMDNKQSER